MREMVHFKPNVQQTLALADPDPVRDQHEWGDFWLYELKDGRILSVSGDVAASINLLELRCGEPFVIVKRWNGERRQKARWDVWRPVESPKAQPDRECSELEDQLRQSLEMTKKPPQSAPSPTPPPTPAPYQPPPAARTNLRRLKPADPRQIPLPFEDSIRQQSKMLTDIFAETLAYSSEKHGIAIQREDIRSLVITSYISQSKRGRGGFNAA